MARLTFKDRKTLARLYQAETPALTIAGRLHCSQATIYNELLRGWTGEVDEFGRRVYDPAKAQRAVQEAARRQGRQARKAAAVRRDC